MAIPKYDSRLDRWSLAMRHTHAKSTSFYRLPSVLGVPAKLGHYQEAGGGSVSDNPARQEPTCRLHAGHRG
jgi:hypothetical protein